MKKFDDQILMAYVDSELGEDERKEVELFLAEDSQAREAVERYRTTRKVIDQFADILDEPVPGHLVDTIRQHERQPKTGSRWMAIAASLVIGVGIGAFTTNHLAVQSFEKKASVSASNMAEQSEALQSLKAEKEIAEKNAVIARRNTASAEKTIAAAKSQIGDITRALQIAQAETEQIQEKLIAANRQKPVEPLAEGVENIFPYKLVSEAIENGSKLSADTQETILTELNREDPPISTASSFSRLIKTNREKGLTTGASQYESLSDLQPAKAQTSELSGLNADTIRKPLDQPKKVKTVLGEFSYSGKTCRLFEYATPHPTETLTLLACRSDSGFWKIIQGQYSQ
ncbi:MAG: hypothetical protein HQ504_01040 [Rhodospirillaceae bacterium]|nr:hypothetical protein [Rhodospirillaceae bacterium]